MTKEEELKRNADIQRMGIAGAVEQLYLQSLEQPTWKDLTEKEILIICAKMAAKLPNRRIDIIFARAIEQALRIKNT